MQQLIFVVGLPGSGKTYLSKEYPDYILIDDPKSKPEFKNSLKYIVCDPHLCKFKVFKQVATLYPNALFIFFKNKPEQCIINVKNRNDGRKITDEYIRSLSGLYNPSILSSLVSNYLIKEVYTNMAINYEYDPSSIVNKTVKKIFCRNDEFKLTFTDDTACKFYHEQDCCETVVFDKEKSFNYLNLLNQKITDVSVDSKSIEQPQEYADSETLTTIRINDAQLIWIGTSNGYYSESVDFKYYDNEFDNDD